MKKMHDERKVEYLVVKCEYRFGDFFTKEVVKRLKSADVEEVVRCKDCFWFEIAVMKADGTPDKRYKADWCALHRIVRDGDDYCSDGWKDED